MMTRGSYTNELKVELLVFNLPPYTAPARPFAEHIRTGNRLKAPHNLTATQDPYHQTYKLGSRP